VTLGQIEHVVVGDWISQTNGQFLMDARNSTASACVMRLRRSPMRAVAHLVSPRTRRCGFPESTMQQQAKSQ
jgi:hypothetical protein